jgi:DNA-binding NtrC family response regulator
MRSTNSSACALPRRVLVIVEDPAFAEVLGEALADAGHLVQLAGDDAKLRSALSAARFDAAIVDLDTRARNGVHLLLHIRAVAPATTLIALLPCGGLPSGAAGVPYHLAIEKPPRLAALLRAVAVAHAVTSN